MTQEYSTKHYAFNVRIKLTQEQCDQGYVDLWVDPYFVSKAWKLGSKDQSGALFHQLKTISRFGDKNSIEREINALFNQAIGMARTHNVQLEVHDWSQIKMHPELDQKIKALVDLVDNYEESMSKINFLIGKYKLHPTTGKVNHLLDKIVNYLPEHTKK